MAPVRRFRGGKYIFFARLAIAQPLVTLHHFEFDRVKHMLPCMRMQEQQPYPAQLIVSSPLVEDFVAGVFRVSWSILFQLDGLIRWVGQ